MSNQIPHYIKDEELSTKITSNWNIIEKDSETGVTLLEFDDWSTNRKERCIKSDGRIIMTFHDYKDEAKMRVASRISFKAIASSLYDGYVFYQP